MLGWHLVSAIVHVAHSGSTGNGVWHQVWSPLRVVGGTSFLFPVNGYCLAQLVAIQCLAGGYLMGNSLWTSFVTASFSPTTLTNTVANVASMPSNDFLIGILSAEACQAYVNYQFEQDNQLNALPLPDEYEAGEAGAGITGVQTNNSQPWESETDTATAHVYSFGQCGTVSIGNDTGSQGWLASNLASTGVNSQNITSADLTFDTAMKSAFQTLMINLWNGSGGGSSGLGLPALALASIVPAQSGPATAPTINATTEITYANSQVQVYQQALVTAGKSFEGGETDFAQSLQTTAT